MSVQAPLQQRESRTDEASKETFDIIVIGGGIHGASVCREATLRGYKVLLLEANDYAFGTSSRSSKMLHGGVRYLEQGDVPLVFEALRERAYFLRNAPHLARPQEFYFPVMRGLTRPGWQVDIGLGLYDLLSLSDRSEAARLFKRHRREAREAPNAKALRDMGLHFEGLFSYFDGQMDDARIVIETLIDSAQLGAVTLNYAPVIDIEPRGDAQTPWKVRWNCKLTGEKRESTGRFLVNASGSWVPEVHALFAPWKDSWPKAVFSRGTHLLFSVPWTMPGLILPTGTKGRYYFVWPYFSTFGAATLVGTTDRFIGLNQENPEAESSEVIELLRFLKRDLPHSGLNNHTLYKTFCGMRVLASKSRRRDVTKLSRAEAVLQEEAYLALLGGKYTTGRSTAEKILRQIDKHFRRSGSSKADEIKIASRPLPGGVNLNQNDLTQRLLSYILERGWLEGGDSARAAQLAASAVRRFGARAEKLLLPEMSQGLEMAPADSPALPAEVRLAIWEEQAFSAEDVLRRRLGIDLEPVSSEKISDLLRTELPKSSIT